MKKIINHIACDRKKKTYKIWKGTSFYSQYEDSLHPSFTITKIELQEYIQRCKEEITDIQEQINKANFLLRLEKEA